MAVGIEIALIEIEIDASGEASGSHRFALAITCRPDDLSGKDTLFDLEFSAEDVFDSHVTRQGFGLIASRGSDDCDGVARFLVSFHDGACLGIDLRGEVLDEDLFAHLLEH